MAFTLYDSPVFFYQAVTNPQMKGLRSQLGDLRIGLNQELFDSKKTGSLALASFSS